MADSEQKARQKLEEAEKKSRKGGGFFGSLLGGGNSAVDACELYNQAPEQSQPQPHEFRCPAGGCWRVLGSVAALEAHYRHAHDFQCGECRAKFASNRALDVHIEEAHSPLFAAKVELYRGRAHFECFAAADCSERFASPEARNEHCAAAHHLSNYGRLNEDGRKTAPTAGASGLATAVRSIRLDDEFSFGADQERAFERARKAGNLFKVAKNWSAAGDAFLKSAELHTAQADAKHDAALDYDKAGTCYRKVDAQKAVECFEKCIEFYTDMGRFNMAAKVHSTIAEIYETEAPNKEQCIKHHQIAADFYKGEEAKSSATKCLIRVAQLSAELGNYRRAIEVFEEIAVFEADHPTLKYAAKNHFFMALLCHLCIDVLDTQNALKRYEDISPSFADSREYKFVKDLTICMEEQSVEHFTETVHGFDKISRLDPWQTSLLLVAKKHCGGEDEEEEEDLR